MERNLKNAVLLVGNDINNATAGYSWKDLLEDLMSFMQLKRVRNMENKPFPLFYEEIFLATAVKGNSDEYGVKKFIAEKVMQLQPNSIHEQILELGCENILTTNYDNTFEKLTTKKKFPNKGVVKESLYNVFRWFDLGGSKLWHIHGSGYTPRSVILGYEHYSGYLHFIRNYVVTGADDTYKNQDFKSVIRQIKKQEVIHRSWVDLFFTNDVYIFGLNLDFAEMHLWWLLTYRARCIHKDKMPINNRIFYFYPRKFEKASQHKLDMFRSTGVITVPASYAENSREKYYGRVMEKIKAQINE